MELIERKKNLVPATDANAAQQLRANALLAAQAAATPVTSLSTSSSTTCTTMEIQQQQIITKMNFAVPAPPPLATSEKLRRLSDSEHFRQPNVTITNHASTVQKQLQEAQTQAQAQALADMILKVFLYNTKHARSRIVSNRT